jgi:hypothetical protein
MQSKAENYLISDEAAVVQSAIDQELQTYLDEFSEEFSFSEEDLNWMRSQLISSFLEGV